jgi:predicted RNA-binding protein YlqC (UPF0109 family)
MSDVNDELTDDAPADDGAPVGDDTDDAVGDDTDDAVGDDTDDAVGDDTDDATGSDAAGAVPREVLDYVARSIVDEPDAVEIEVEERRNGIELRLHVAPDDMGKIIGRRGRVAQAIRTVVRAAGAKDGVDASVDIVD